MVKKLKIREIFEVITALLGCGANLQGRRERMEAAGSSKTLRYNLPTYTASYVSVQ
jgi:hypothetical protein